MKLKWLRKKMSNKEIKEMLKWWGYRLGDYDYVVTLTIENDDLKLTIMDEDGVETDVPLTKREEEVMLWKAYTWWKRKKRRYRNEKRRGYQKPPFDDKYKFIKQFLQRLENENKTMGED